MRKMISGLSALPLNFLLECAKVFSDAGAFIVEGVKWNMSLIQQYPRTAIGLYAVLAATVVEAAFTLNCGDKTKFLLPLIRIKLGGPSDTKGGSFCYQAFDNETVGLKFAPGLQVCDVLNFLSENAISTGCPLGPEQVSPDVLKQCFTIASQYAIFKTQDPSKTNVLAIFKTTDDSATRLLTFAEDPATFCGW